ncbi:type III-B CRISPR module-associated Cmr3 family protein [Paralimibaculum aggregatum]|uniref:Type III-B CRISPR module-associated Cmr3 family protein n=1 Tax=Paralimibaculum aggregatum TaxID=3036245 RepID=A0ABQ6LTF3_9RHOB|nr:RAMP superfamily CRISPR-associated protein [Limibaculum sp. NKW23]GMG85346.1 type III-B CRISPR module-associated Cmr3 family protein [Limibaculum sp. NKW23]
MTLYWRLPVSVTVISPWAIPGDEAAGTGQDIRLARDAKKRLILPGTHVKGHLRAALEAMAEETHIARSRIAELLGSESSARGPDWTDANVPHRGSVSVGDLAICACTPEPPATGSDAPWVGDPAVRIEIDEDLGSVREGNLLFVECPFSFGTEVTFAGDILLRASEDAAKTRELIARAAERVFAIGGMKSVGYGRVKPGSWKIGAPAAVRPADAEPTAARLTIEWQIDRPFLVNASRESGNLVIGDEIIPGGAIKGALAALMARSTIAPEQLSAIRISHAFPASDSAPTAWRRPIPLSISIASGSAWCHLLGDVETKREPHRFQGDWKEAERAAVKTALGWPDVEPEKAGRSRTAIDAETLGARYIDEDQAVASAVAGQEGGQLFSAIAVRPGGHRWVGEIAGDAAVLQQVLAIAKIGIPWLGKTQAIITATSWQPAAAASVLEPGSYYNLCLITEAALLNPEDLRKGTTLFDAYASTLARLGLKLERSFTREELRGGYLALRYPPESGGYSPWLVTLPGSVLRVSVEDAALAAQVLAHGLPPADCYSEDWQRTPFLRENGYGQVCHDLVDHATLARGLSLKGAGT